MSEPAKDSTEPVNFLDSPATAARKRGLRIITWIEFFVILPIVFAFTGENFVGLRTQLAGKTFSETSREFVRTLLGFLNRRQDGAGRRAQLFSIAISRPFFQIARKPNREDISLSRNSFACYKLVDGIDPRTSLDWVYLLLHQQDRITVTSCFITRKFQCVKLNSQQSKPSSVILQLRYLLPKRLQC